jgi:hypothetical protein
MCCSLVHVFNARITEKQSIGNYLTQKVEDGASLGNKRFAYDTGAVSFMKGDRPVVRVMLAITKKRWRNGHLLCW